MVLRCFVFIRKKTKKNITDLSHKLLIKRKKAYPIIFCILTVVNKHIKNKLVIMAKLSIFFGIKCESVQKS